MGVDLRLINKRGEQKMKESSAFPGRWLTYYRFYYHSKAVSRQKVIASKYYMNGDSRKHQS